MLIYKSFSNIYDQSLNCVFATPDTCPMCHKQIEPVFLTGYVSISKTLSVFLYCKGCDSTFISRFQTISGESRHINSTYGHTRLLESVPFGFEPKVFDHRILSLSERFAIVFNQAFQAECMGLLEIAGAGYRKSLEILIKDFAISYNRDKENYIKDPKYSLSKCIEEFISDEEIKDLSKASSWLGNDETHYTRQHTEQDLADLLRFLDSTVAFVNYKLAASDAKSFIAKT